MTDDTMRAAVVRRYGSAAEVRVDRVPVARAGRGEALVRVHATAVTSADARIRGSRFPPGFTVPGRLAFGIVRLRQPVLGGVLSGIVEDAGAGADGVRLGDAVCGMTGMRMGAHAELVAVPARCLVPKPDAVGHDDAAGVLFGGTTALHFLHAKGGLREKDSVLVIGASGAVGSNAVQLARLAGATVTGVCSAANAALVSSLGAHRVIDYRDTPPDALRERYDMVLDAVGTLTAASGRRLLKEDGRLLLVSAGLGDTLRARGRISAGAAEERPGDFTRLLDLVAAGRLRVVTDRVLPLSQIAAAHARVDSGRKIGNVIVRPIELDAQ